MQTQKTEKGLAPAGNQTTVQPNQIRQNCENVKVSENQCYEMCMNERCRCGCYKVQTK